MSVSEEPGATISVLSAVAVVRLYFEVSASLIAGSGSDWPYRRAVAHKDRHANANLTFLINSPIVAFMQLICKLHRPALDDTAPY